MSISVQAVSKHKNVLLDRGYIVHARGTLYYDRGPNAKFLETREVKLQLNPDDVSDNPLEPGLKPAESPLTFTAGQTKTIAQDTVGCHMNGSVRFIVDKIGDFERFHYRRPGLPVDEDPEVIEFLDPTPYNKHHGNEFFLGRLRLPDKLWTVTVQLHSTKRMDKLYIWPPEVELTADEVADSVDAEEKEQQFFSKEVYDIVYFLEKHAEWKFRRDPGRGTPVAEISQNAKIEYANRNPDLLRGLPKGISGFKDIDDMWIDQSKGVRELESSGLRRMRALFTAADKFDEHEARLVELDVKIQKAQAKMKEHILILYDHLEEIMEIEETNMRLKLFKEAQNKSQKTLDDLEDDKKGYQ